MLVPRTDSFERLAVYMNSVRPYGKHCFDRERKLADACDRCKRRTPQKPPVDSNDIRIIQPDDALGSIADSAAVRIAKQLRRFFFDRSSPTEQHLLVRKATGLTHNWL